jgi:uncharacterized protein
MGLLSSLFFGVLVFVGNVPVDVEIATTLEERAQGLMHRKTPLKDSEGMLFEFPYGQKATFHMKNTFLSLDILFFDENGVLNQYYEKTKINQEKEKYPSRGKVRWVLEMPAGWIKENRITQGFQLHLCDHKYLRSE